MNVYSVAELVLLGLLAVQCARLTWTVATPVAPLGDWRPAAAGVPASPAEVLRGFDAFFRISGSQAPQAVTTLGVKLFGVRVDEATGRGAAIVAGPDGVQTSVSVGEEVAPGAKLTAVAFDHVTIERGGAAETLYLDQSGAAPPAPDDDPETEPPVPSTAPRLGTVTVQQLQTDIGYVPRLDGGRVSGLAVRAEGSGAAFRAAGLRDGDVVTALGNRPVTGEADLQRIARDYPRGGSVPMVVERGGQTLPLSLPLAPQSMPK